MGLILGLSDDAIDKLKNAFYNKSVLNAIIENDNFEMLMEKAHNFLKEGNADHEYAEYSLSKVFLYLMNSIEKKQSIGTIAKNKRNSIIKLSNLSNIYNEHSIKAQNTSNIRIKHYTDRFKEDIEIRNKNKGDGNK